jgi:hypothetical protein
MTSGPMPSPDKTAIFIVLPSALAPAAAAAETAAAAGAREEGPPRASAGGLGKKPGACCRELPTVARDPDSYGRAEEPRTRDWNRLDARGSGGCNRLDALASGWARLAMATAGSWTDACCPPQGTLLNSTPRHVPMSKERSVDDFPLQEAPLLGASPWSSGIIASGARLGMGTG